MDSPGVKTTYTATVTAPEWCTVLMSALSDNTGVEPKGVNKWRQPVPTSAYLIALAAGNLDFRDISRRVRIWAGLLCFVVYFY
jgi:leukotriene-A4 hydrolase